MAKSLMAYDRGGESSSRKATTPMVGERVLRRGINGESMLAREKENGESECERVRIGLLQVLNALQKRNVPQVLTGKGQASMSEGLLYVEAKLNRKPAHVLVDTGVTHNFITMEEAERLGLNVVAWGGGLKTVNTKVKPLQGTVRRVKIFLGKWKGMVDFSVARMDDFKVVLGLDLLQHVNVLVSPYNNACKKLKGRKPRRARAYLESLKVEDNNAPSTEQPPKGILGVLEGKEDALPRDQPREMVDVPKGKEDVVPREFEKRQTLRRKVGDQGKLDRGAKPQNVAPCGMAPPKVEKLETTLKEKWEIVKLIKEGLHRDPLAKELLQLVKNGKTQ
ncbi:hypothetical protein RJ640_030915 [Escallonia rubra]|uniref:Uncharacterized protein n=1 Tax=Escallonia rubra TaxID=112253 RepID=A0AA88RH16_9ASTE|nr:hypothetical protein RJ640_030915 [Escallonia rubra]